MRHVAPEATFRFPTVPVTAGQSFTLALDGARVPAYPAATTFTYAFDCGTGVYGATTTSASASCPTASTTPSWTTLTVLGKVIDQDGDVTEYADQVTVGQPPQPQTITFTTVPPSPALVGGTYLVAAEASSLEPVTLSSLTPATCTLDATATETTVTFVSSGTCTIAADQAGTADFLPAPRVTQSITVTR
jgi:hypothetical protein